jgi:hypothetical protein
MTSDSSTEDRIPAIKLLLLPKGTNAMGTNFGVAMPR